MSRNHPHAAFVASYLAKNRGSVFAEGTESAGPRPRCCTAAFLEARQCQRCGAGQCHCRCEGGVQDAGEQGFVPRGAV